GWASSLYQPEMAFGQRKICIAGERAEDWNAERGNGFANEQAMTFAADAIEHHAGDANGGIVGREAADERSGRLRLARDVEDEQHRQSETRGAGGGRPRGPSGGGRTPP